MEIFVELTVGCGSSPERHVGKEDFLQMVDFRNILCEGLSVLLLYLNLKCLLLL